MYSFKNDYSEGAHPNILKALMKSNMEQTEGYGEDKYSIGAIKLLKDKLKCNDIDIHMFCGGTQTNLTSISAFLRPHEAVISASTGHVLVHETGAIEATGHKVISVKVDDGKLKPIHIKMAIDEHTDEHMVKPKMVYISNPTEIGTIYKKQELKDLYDFCTKNNIILYVDGARLGSALCSKENDIKISDLPKLTDVFYIGGTKNGALMGEALVICKEGLKEDFRYHIKQKGGLLAKGRLIGIQFFELFKNDLYFDLARHANFMAETLKLGIKECGYKFLINSSTNQIFPILHNKTIEKLQENYLFFVWQKIDEDNSAVRLVTSWATKDEHVKSFIDDLKLISK
ncbi:threonine aldolase family protein [Clostridium estertheticum]|uniref:Aminotransferase class I/II-fold pyridoxal phosphate-dependent enzyme n=1 Tax=Clostridium estertheticum TaxID=238834 RepID=A0A5N7IN49_9CLOT|nr:aminotransferase class I/II-fold pyridoxal phosphate-dependent enzyme [Clostridium estertheticum]MPQ31740.1 aminotransferase class I/II-fold pyridoxal phosphate-dependent enzyme [Clostridium estertheticum]MPQ62407.1 aminotransferase class I/II-fold pyridoxal phosphate-dependent enzyme [Clostridium estertheticum]NNU77224.1 aminotransferase class I/II-fold pyridoxal phosphate-dependent enzyme [Clostridium estertheticum]WBL45660.1 aminotransferase class I/II-fold pyridoxal phosphate-dependent e